MFVVWSHQLLTLFLHQKSKMSVSKMRTTNVNLNPKTPLASKVNIKDTQKGKAKRSGESLASPAAPAACLSSKRAAKRGR